MAEIDTASKSDKRVFKQELFDDFKRLADCSQDAIYHYDIGSQRFLFHNQKFRSFFRLKNGSDNATPSDQIVKSIHPEDREHVRRCAVAMLKGVSLTPYEFCVLDKSGSTHWVMESLPSVIYRDKRAVLAYFMDVTKLHQMKDNLSTLGLMVGTISHSLRGCLSGLNASLYLIETGFYRNRPAQIEEGLDVTKLMADRIRKLVLDILYYSKERDLEREEVEVWQFSKEVAILIEKRIKAANIQFITDFSYDAGYFAIDPEIIRAGLLNILENAMEACIEDKRDITHWIRFTASVDKAKVYFEISDNGPGIEKEQASKIFQLFSSSKGKRGTGIGLFVTRKAILKHGGTINVDSSPSGGAKFRITLPRKPRIQN